MATAKKAEEMSEAIELRLTELREIARNPKANVKE